MTTDSPNRTWLERLSHLLSREPQDRHQLMDVLRDSEQRHLLDADALTMMEGVLQVSEMQVRDIMIPRSHMVVVEADESPEAFLPTIIASAHSRFPVIGENLDEILGILLAKDLLKLQSHTDTPQAFDIRDWLRPAVFVPESKRLDVLLKEFRQKRNHMAIVVNEYGSVDGLITIEDVLEEIVGDIEDEHDAEEQEESFIKPQSDGTYIIQALTPIEDFNEQFHCTLSDANFDTMGGLVTHALGHVPKKGETVKIDHFLFKVIASDRRQLRTLQLIQDK
ncbi:MAG: HlyC/CorC family transporter [Gammaproteobacteria bacterium]